MFFWVCVVRYTAKGYRSCHHARKYLQEALLECGMNTAREAATPAPKCLFGRRRRPAFGSGRCTEKHSIASQQSCCTCQTRLGCDLLLPIVFLSTRVSKSTQQDRAKLKRVLSASRAPCISSIPLALTTWVACGRGWGDAGIRGSTQI
jgi:hypothetical protein